VKDAFGSPFGGGLVRMLLRVRRDVGVGHYLTLFCVIEITSPSFPGVPLNACKEAYFSFAHS
jgi:hypothetical protein